MGRGAGEDTQLGQIVCAGNVAADGTVRKERGCVVARTGAGVYTITINPVAVDGETVTQQGNLSGGIPAAELVSEVQVAGAAEEAYSQIANTSDTVKTLSIIDDADAPLDADFEFILKRSMFASSNP